MKAPRLLAISLLSSFALSSHAQITTFAEYRLGEDGVRERPRDNSGNGRNFVAGGDAGSFSTENLSPATVTTAVLRTDEELFTAFRADQSSLATDNFAVGIYAYIPADDPDPDDPDAPATSATRGHLISLGGRDESVLRISLEDTGWVATYRDLGGNVNNDPGTQIGDAAPLVPDTWVHLAVIRSGGETTFYVDGAAQGLPETTVTPIHGNNGHIGVDPGGARRIQGQFDDCRILTFTAGETAADILAALVGIDSEPDGLLDSFEQRIIDASGGALTDFLSVLPEADFDLDGATNLQEMDAATDPTDPADTPVDRDRDGMLDTFEQQIIDFAANDGDPSNDDLTIETILPGDDFDGDGFDNIVEFNALPMASNPADVNSIPLDIDRDLMLDSFEQMIIDFAATDDNPDNDNLLTIQDVLPEDDFDNDTFLNIQEFERGTDPTDPLDPGIPTLSLLAFWDFNDSSNPALTEDLVDGIDGTVVSPAVFTADAGGRTATAGDRAMDLGGQGNGAYVLVEDASFLDAIVPNQRLTMSVWARAAWLDVNGDPQTGQLDAATGLPNSPQTIAVQVTNANQGGRLIQSHLPWSSNQIFWDQPAKRHNPQTNGISGTTAEARQSFLGRVAPLCSVEGRRSF